MTTFGSKLDTLYRKLGSRGLLLAIFTAALALNVVYSLRMSLPSLPEEFGTAAWSAYFSGFGEAPPPESGGSPWLTGFLYTPVYYLIDNPVIRFRSMLVMNSIFAALIPLLTYKITAALGLAKAWQRTMCSGIVAICTAVFAHTKLITAETLCVFLPFLLFWLFISAANTKVRAVRFFLSFFAAIVLASAPAAHFRLWTLVITFILLVIYSHVILRVKAISFVGFFPAFAGFTVLQLYINQRLTGEIFTWRAIQSDYIEQLYRFAVSTWGIGVLAIILCVSALRRRNPLLKAFAFFALVYNAFLVSADSAPPFLVLFAFCFIFMHGLDFRMTTITAITLGIIFVLYYSEASLPEVSAVFCIIALLFVLVSCAERYRSHIITFSLSLALLYSGFGAVPAPVRHTEALAVSEQIYNSADAPPTYIIDNDSADFAPLLRFLNRNTTINTAESFDELPEDCFVFVRDESGGFIFAAHGERAQAYVLSQED